MRKGFIAFIFIWIFVWLLSYPTSYVGSLGVYIFGNYCLYLFVLFSVLFAGILIDHLTPKK